MEINVVGRRMDVPDRFRRHIEDKLEKVSQFAPRAQLIAVEISHENNPRRSEQADRVELTVRDAGAVIRSEARADDLYAAFDVAYGKLLERLRRARDRHKDHRRGKSRSHETPESLRTMPAVEVPLAEDEVVLTEEGEQEAEKGAELGESPIVIREKTHSATPMTVDDALYQMELVGHDFYLFVDSETRRHRVVYRRKGWSYGVIELEVEGE
ncbi:ribosome-associated translation inhibitor RaiA [Dermabacteraceae bacterium TAE3-ERU27]|nr:ribosome-associated translation inhibitor RaiA [Dermabacteraceae bacterium TAE3-ERU27]